MDPNEIEDRAMFVAELKRMRTAAGLSYAALAREVAMSKSTIHGWMTGTHLPYLRDNATFQRLLTALGVPYTDHAAWIDLLNRLRNPVVLPAPTETEDVGEGADPLDGVSQNLTFREEIAEGEGRDDLLRTIEQLLGLASSMIDDGSFDDDVLLEEQVTDDRNFLQRELSRSHVINAAVVAPLVQRLQAALVTRMSVDDPAAAVVAAVAGMPDANPQDPMTAETKAQVIAEALERSPHATLPPDQASWKHWVMKKLQWTNRAYQEAGAAGTGLLGGAGIAQLLGAGGVASTIIGVVTALLAVVFRPRS